MGSPKALLKIEGKTFVERLWGLLDRLPLGWRKVVTSPTVGVPLPHLINPEQERGPIGSIQMALRSGAAEFAWLMVLSVDRPHLQQSTLQALAAAAQSTAGDLWVPRYQGRRGHPIVFGKACYADLLAAPDDPGARWVVGRHLEQRVEVEVADAAVLDNWDTPQALPSGLAGPGPRAGDDFRQ